MSLVTPTGVAAEPVGQPVDAVREALDWYVAGGPTGTRRSRRRQAAAFQLMRIDHWPAGEAAQALGYTPQGLRLAVERVRSALAAWWTERAEDAEGLAAVA